MIRFFNTTGDDFAEKQAIRGSTLARDILAVEDASEIAKEYMFDTDTGVFEKIINSIGGGHCQTFSRSSKIRCVKKNEELLHLGFHISKNIGGHYSGAVKKGNTVTYFDSMCESPYRPHFKKFIKKRYGPKVNIKQEFNRHRFQPSGGFAPNTIQQLMTYMKNARVNTNEDPRKLFYVSQFDLLSQHHFCYIESFVYLCHKVLGTPIGPIDPERRLRFIKSILWCLVMKYANPDTTTQMFKYFYKNFRYYIKLKDVRYNPKGFYIPKKYFTGLYTVKKIRLMPVSIAKLSSIRSIIKWSLRA